MTTEAPESILSNTPTADTTQAPISRQKAVQTGWEYILRHSLHVTTKTGNEFVVHDHRAVLVNLAREFKRAGFVTELRELKVKYYDKPEEVK